MPSCWTGPAPGCGWWPTSPSATTTSTWRPAPPGGCWPPTPPTVAPGAPAAWAWARLRAAARRVAEGDRFLRARRPWVWGPEFFLGFEVHGKTLGVVGLGRIGRAVARRAAGFGMPVLYTARRRLPPAGEAAPGGGRRGVAGPPGAGR